MITVRIILIIILIVIMITVILAASATLPSVIAVSSSREPAGQHSLTLSLIRLLDSNFLGSPLWT